MKNISIGEELIWIKTILSRINKSFWMFSHMLSSNEISSTKSISWEDTSTTSRISVSDWIGDENDSWSNGI